MKILLFILFYFLSHLHCTSQNQIHKIDSITHKWYFEKIISLDSLPKHEIYTKARIWIAHEFINNSNVIRMDDIDSGILICKGVIVYDFNQGLYKYEGYTYFLLTINVKHGKLKIKIEDLHHKCFFKHINHSGGDIENDKPACGTSHLKYNNWQSIKGESVLRINNLIDDFTNFMINTQNIDNW